MATPATGFPRTAPQAAAVAEPSGTADVSLLEIFTTSIAAPGSHLDLWREQVQLTYGTLQVLAKKDEFVNGTIRTGRFGNVQASLISADPHAVIRSNRITGAADEGYLCICRPETGTACLKQDSKEATVQTGDIVCFDSRRPYTLAMPNRFTMISLRFPHELVGLKPDNTRCLTAAPWPGNNGVGALVGHLLSGFGRHLGEMDGAANELLGSGIASLISALFATRLRESIDDPLVARQVLLMRVQTFARQSLANLDLTPIFLAKRHNISLRYLQQLFADTGTSPAKWIREERLTRCHDDLRDPRNDYLTVADIGKRWGLDCPSNMSRLFRDQYGLTPSELRRRCAGSETPGKPQ